MNENTNINKNDLLIQATVDGREKSPVLSEFEQFKRARGWEFKTEEELQSGYERYGKGKTGILLTLDEFITEAGIHYEAEKLTSVYEKLTELVSQNKLHGSEIYQYAHFKWCLRNPEAVVAYQESRDKWIVNNCGDEITEEKAIVKVNREWGFEASRIKIIGTPYYTATDYQFIRFDCAHMTWLWKNSSIYQVYS